MDLQGKKVTVVGLGKSGIAACKLLLAQGAKVNLTDCLDNQRIRAGIHKLKGETGITRIETGRHSEDLISGQDLVVTSPGVPGDSLPLRWARQQGIPVIGEIELAFAFCPAPIIAITGTNGKTTVSSLVGQIFRQAGYQCVVCGNIGIPFSAEVAWITSEQIVVLEVSSFQLETIDRFKPKVAAVLNLSDDHLDRYPNFEQYLAAKCRIFSNQDQTDWAVLNKQDSSSRLLAASTQARVIYFSQDKDYREGSRRLNSNHFAALAICSLFNIAEDIAIKVCLNFRGIEHRIEEVRQIRGIDFINDSKATNVGSTLWALSSLSRPIILIAGGRDKGSDFTAAGKEIKRKVKAMVLLGEASEKIAEALGNLTTTRKTKTLIQAVDAAFRLAESGDCILFSPMCASFDMFSDYAERGRAFKQAVQNLAQDIDKAQGSNC